MGEIKWIKLSTDVFNNRKIRQIECMPDGDTIIVIWFKILALAGEINDSGQVYLTKEIPYTEQLLATQFNRPIATVRLALQTFQQFGMIEIIDNLILVSNWEKYQNIEGMERVREQNRLRNIQYRERKRLAAANSSCDNTVTSRETSRDAVEEEKEKDKEIDTPPIIPPTGGMTTTTTTPYTPAHAEKKEPPGYAEVFRYFKDYLCIDCSDKETEKFYAWNNLHGWDCLPDWKAAAELWAARIDEHNGSGGGGKDG